ncbi:MAG: sulfotransferase, partial [Nitrospinae bacterium]|nr:sulfotransferase [Nitrospinota bacterium]
MKGTELLELFPAEVKAHADPQRLKLLAATQTLEEFREVLIKFAKESHPVWIYGFPRTGSTWICKKFFNAFTDSQFMEPFTLFQCNSVNYTDEIMNKGSDFEQPWLTIQKVLGINSLAVDRLLLAIHSKFFFKFLFDFTIVPQLITIYPKSKFIWMMRDGRDSVDSFSNPDLNHWPYADFTYLGEGKEKRFQGAMERWMNFSVQQFRTYEAYEKNILALKYEDFATDFQATAKTTLDFCEVPFHQEKVHQLMQGFKSRHGMWKDWESWQKELFVESKAEQLNRSFGYGRETNSRGVPWNQP